MQVHEAATVASSVGRDVKADFASSSCREVKTEQHQRTQPMPRLSRQRKQSAIGGAAFERVQLDDKQQVSSSRLDAQQKIGSGCPSDERQLPIAIKQLPGSRLVNSARARQVSSKTEAVSESFRQLPAVTEQVSGQVRATDDELAVDGTSESVVAPKSVLARWSKAASSNNTNNNNSDSNLSSENNGPKVSVKSLISRFNLD